MTARDPEDAGTGADRRPTAGADERFGPGEGREDHESSPTDAELATEIALEAGDLLLSIRENAWRLAVNHWQLGRYADHRANALILERLAAGRPDDAVLSEEEVDDGNRLGAGRVWIVDPLDGTRAFMMGRDDWAVHVALWEAGVGVTAAAVNLPAIGRVFSTDSVADEPPGRLLIHEGAPLILVSPSRPPMFAPFVARALGAQLATMGSAGFKAMVVLCGGAIAYLHNSGQNEWDSAAPVGVLQAAGFHASRLDGSALEYNKPDPHVTDFLLCRPDLADRFLEAIDESRRLGPRAW